MIGPPIQLRFSVDVIPELEKSSYERLLVILVKSNHNMCFDLHFFISNIPKRSISFPWPDGYTNCWKYCCSSSINISKITHERRQSISSVLVGINKCWALLSVGIRVIWIYPSDTIICNLKWNIFRGKGFLMSPFRSYTRWYSHREFHTLLPDTTLHLYPRMNFVMSPMIFGGKQLLPLLIRNREPKFACLFLSGYWNYSFSDHNSSS